MIEFKYSTGNKLKTIGPVPENYNELTSKQLIRLCRLFIRNEEKDIASLKALCILIGYGRYRFFRLHCSVKERMLPQVSWVFEKNGLTVQLLPVVKGFYGPAGQWDNLTMEEWNACEIYYYQMITEQSDEALNNLIAVLYRKPKKSYDREMDPDGDIRVPFNSNVCAYYAKKVKGWPTAVKISIMMWYDGCREYMKQVYDVFDDSPTKAEEKDPGMFEVIRSLTGERYGSFDKVSKLNVHMAMREMELLKKEVAAQKAAATNTK